MSTRIVWVGEGGAALCVGQALIVCAISASTGQTTILPDDASLDEYSPGPKLAESGLLRSNRGRRSSLASMAVLSAESISDAGEENKLGVNQAGLLTCRSTRCRQ
jgi:hypothetical protein